MKATLLALTLILMGPLAHAGTGQGAVSCNSGDGIVALYTYFNSNADSYTTLELFVKNYATGGFKHYSNMTEDGALKPVSVTLKDGRKITVAADKDLSGCTISQ